jgi:hypothetical protein
MGSSEPMMPIEERTELRWTQMRVHFPPVRAKSLIPVRRLPTVCAVRRTHFSGIALFDWLRSARNFKYVRLSFKDLDVRVALALEQGPRR